MGPRRLSRLAGGRPPAPVRIVHLGVGNFARAHQAWYTDRASDAEQWGIAAFTGQSRSAAEVLTAQDGLYTLLVRAESGPTAEVVSSLSAVRPGGDTPAVVDALSAGEVAVVTLTVTEAGYCRRPDGGLDLESGDVRADAAALTGGGPLGPGPLRTMPGRLVAGLRARRAAGGGPLAVVSCDNVPDNGAMTRRITLELARRVDRGLADWVEAQVSFVSTVVDRITPRASDEDRRVVGELTGFDDPAVVVTEPFSEWVLAGDFPAGRPDWASAGARFVEDVAPFERRKLWLLNGAHSILAYAGSIAGHSTVASAMADPQVRGWVEEWWDCAGPLLPLPADEVAAYRRALVERFTNPAIAHRLEQIATDGSQKVPIRAVPVLRAARESGEMPTGATRFVAAWVAHLRGHGAPVRDVESHQLGALVAGPVPDAVAAVLHWLGLDDGALASAVAAQVVELESLATGGRNR